MELNQWITTKLGQDIWEKKYKFENENLDEWFERVSGGDAELKQLIKEKKFLFGGRALTNRNTDNKGSMFNCYSIGYAPDDYEGLLELNKNLGLTYKAQGGQGVSMSKLRPKGTPIGKRFYSDGIVPFMEIFNSTTEQTSQGGSRKGALMISLDIRHKEADTFIKIKSQEGKIEKANLSLEIDDKFMQAVDTYYKTGEVITLHEKREYSGHVVEYDVIPIELYKLLVQNCYDWADPACLFTNRFRNYNLMELDDEYQIETSNPCLHKDTYMVTINGLEKISQLRSNIWNGNNFVPSKSWKTGIKKVYKVMTQSGFEYIATEDHKFLLQNGDWCNVIELVGKNIAFDYKEKEWIGINPHPQANYEILGFEFGDGGYHKASYRMKYIHANPEKDKEVITLIEKEFNDKFEPKQKNKPDIHHVIKIPYGTIYANGFYDKIENRMIPNWIMTLPKKEMRLFLRGLFSANGCNLKNHHKIQLVSINADMLKQVQQMLLLFGIKGKLWYHSKQQDIEFENGIYNCKQSAHIVISRNSYKKFLDNIGFIQEYKNGYNDFQNKTDENFETVILVSELDEAEVWDFEEPISHQGVTNGSIVHNCGEQPLPPNFCCNLGSLNLAEFVKNPFTKDAYFDTNIFTKAINIAVRALDDIIDENANNHPLQTQRDNSLNYRNIGLGVFGYASALMKLRLKYGSESAKEWTNNLFNLLFREAVKSSINLAKEKGSFPKYKECVFDSEIIRKHFTPNEIEGFKKCGIRNCSLISIAPTGSIATMLGETGGCEPEFAIKYTRKTESLDDGKEKSFNIFCKTAQEYINKTQNTELPEYFVGSADINWMDRVEVQAIMQEHVDTAISSTVNLPNTATLEEVEQLYIYAWKQGLKGITIYRNGCKREGILTTKSKTQAPIDYEYVELPRGFIEDVPDGLTYRKYKLETGCGKLYFFLGIDEDEGKIYDCFTNTDGVGGCSINTQANSRLLSAALRGGVPISYLAEQLNKSGVCPSFQYKKGKGEKLCKGKSCPSAIGNILKEVLKEFENQNKEIEVKSTNKIIIKNDTNKCPECKEILVYEGGCIQCKLCGWSRCS